MSKRRCIVHVAPGLAEFIRAQAPDARHKLRLAVRGLEHERGDIQPLEGELRNYYRLRVGAYRIIFRYGPARGGNQAIFCVFGERRSVVYVLLEDLLRRGLKNPEG